MQADMKRTRLRQRMRIHSKKAVMTVLCLKWKELPPFVQVWKEANQLLDLLLCFEFDSLFVWFGFLIFQSLKFLVGITKHQFHITISKGGMILFWCSGQTAALHFDTLNMWENEHTWRQIQPMFISTFTSPTRSEEATYISSLKGEEGIKYKNCFLCSLPA